MRSFWSLYINIESRLFALEVKRKGLPHIYELHLVTFNPSTYSGMLHSYGGLEGSGKQVLFNFSITYSESQKIKVVRDKLLAVGVIIDDEELLHITIKGLSKEYNAFRLAIRTRSTLLSFDELFTLLNVEKESLNETLDSKDHVFAIAATINNKSNGNFN